MNMAHTSHEMITTIWWGVVLGALFAGLLSKIPREFIISSLGKGGTFLGLLRATGAGVLLDLCSHGILIVGMKLYERGASIGQVIAFLLASPWNSFSLTLILFTLIGLKWTIIFIVLSMLVALIAGFIFDKLAEKKILPSNPHNAQLPKNFDFFKDAKAGLKQAKFDFEFFKSLTLAGMRDSKRYCVGCFLVLCLPLFCELCLIRSNFKILLVLPLLDLLQLFF